MKNKFLIGSLKCMVISFIIGMILIFLSTSIGLKMGYDAIQASGGGMETSQYEIIVKSNIDNFRTGGFVFSFIGGLGILMSGYTLYKNIED